MKKLIAWTLSASLMLGSALALTPEEAFPKKLDYPGFSDVQPTDWFAATAQTCYELGLITGTDHGFAPTEKITVGSVAAIAARMNAAITGHEIPAPVPDPSVPWYQHYLDYLAPLGVQVDNPTADATRLEFLKMLAAVIPNEMLTAKNDITALPDTSDQIVLKFYRAGILTGVDEYGTFMGDRSLMRSEVAAMVARIARSEQRAEFTPKVPENPEALLLKAAGLKADDILFFGYSGQLTAAQYLPRVITEISLLEAAAAAQGEEFNWFHQAADGRTYLATVEENALADTGLTSKDATDLWKDVYDTQVFYSRYIDLTGNHL